MARRFARDGYQVHGIGHGKWTHELCSDYGISQWVEASITLDSLKSVGVKPNALIHCAGGSSVGFSMTHPQTDFEKTVTTTSSVLEFVRKYSPNTRIVFPSSAAVYGQIDQLPIREDQPPAPISTYGIHKVIAEELLRHYGRVFAISVCVVRLFSVYGEGLRKQLLWDACCKLSKGEFQFHGTGTEIRDWIHLSDAADLILLAERNATPWCPIINGASGVGVTVRDILEVLFDSWGSNEKLTFDSRLAQGDPERYLADISIARSLGWNPRVSWSTGIAMYVEWFLTLRP